MVNVLFGFPCMQDTFDDLQDGRHYNPYFSFFILWFNEGLFIMVLLTFDTSAERVLIDFSRVKSLIFLPQVLVVELIQQVIRLIYCRVEFIWFKFHKNSSNAFCSFEFTLFNIFQVSNPIYRVSLMFCLKWTGEHSR